jgi:phospholipid/cholesterol/gamma-HCH transport system permease protein
MKISGSSSIAVEARWAHISGTMAGRDGRARLGPVWTALTWPLTYAGARATLLWRAARSVFRPPPRGNLILRQMQFVGVASLPIVLIVGLFSGGVAAESTLAALAAFRQENNVGGLVGVSLARELAPVFTALMLSARAGAGIAAELGSMRISEQVDALVAFNVDPNQYLVMPRILASMVMTPVMTMVFNLVALWGAYLVAIDLKGVDPGAALASFRYYTDPLDYTQGLIKAAVFGVAFSLAACQQGLEVRGGARELGQATTKAVVEGAVSILVLDYFLTDLMLIWWPPMSR